jgi:hypothetical protein
VESGAAEREQLLHQQIRAMEPGRFEQLVFTLVQLEHPSARRIEHPDGGADVLLPAQGTTPAEVWQAKRYPNKINWAKCTKSLADAIGEWRPSRVTFVFARNLSKHGERAFAEKLVRHPDAVKQGVEIGLWNLSHLVSLLESNAHLIPRFFGSSLELHIEKLDRMVQAGGKLQTAEDLVERAEAIRKFADQQDVDFKYSTVTGDEIPDWSKLPYVAIDVDGVHIAAFVREGADVTLPTFGFIDDEIGREAREQAVRDLARGEEAKITRGFRVQMAAPKILQEFAAQRSLEGGTVSIVPGDVIPLGLEIAFDGEALTWALELRPVPPLPDATASYAGYVGSSLIELSFTLLDKPAIRVALAVRTELGASARDNAEAAALLYAFYAQRNVVLRNDTFWPDTGNLSGKFGDLGHNEQLAEMAWLRHFFADAAFIERRFGVELPLPPQLSSEQIDQVGTVANILRTGEGTATFTKAEGTVTDPHAIPGLPDRLRTERRDVIYEVLGKQVNLGPADYELPRLKIVDIVPHGTGANAPARVVLEADGSPEMVFRLVDRHAPE